MLGKILILMSHYYWCCFYSFLVFRNTFENFCTNCQDFINVKKYSCVESVPQIERKKVFNDRL